MTARGNPADAKRISRHPLPPLGPGQVGVVDGGHRQAQPQLGGPALQQPGQAALAGPHRTVEGYQRPLPGGGQPLQSLQKG